jgi:hypothetical protein
MGWTGVMVTTVHDHRQNDVEVLLIKPEHDLHSVQLADDEKLNGAR